jgi:predicted Zn-dependent protease
MNGQKPLPGKGAMSYGKARFPLVQRSVVATSSNQPMPSFWNDWALKRRDPIDMPLVTGPLTRMATHMMAANGLDIPFRVCVVNQPGYNAGALSNGTMTFNLGLLQQAKCPEELAFVMAHEISHLEHKHHERYRKYFLGAVAGSFVAGESLIKALKIGRKAIPKRLMVLASVWLPQVPWLTQMRRNHEMEADRSAIRLLTKAGYSAEGYDSSMVNMTEAEDSVSWRDKIRQVIGNTHPPVPVRQAALTQLMQTQPTEPSPKSPMSAEEWHTLKQTAASYQVQDEE